MLQWFQDLVAGVERLLCPDTPDDTFEEKPGSFM